MSVLFCDILNRSITAGILILVVLILRLILKKAPKWISVLLWGFVAVRLFMPFAIESPLSLLPETNWISLQSFHQETEYFDSGSMNASFGNTFSSDELEKAVLCPVTVQSGKSIHAVAFSVAASIWLLGIGCFLFYMGFSTVRLHRRVRGAVRQEKRVFLCDTLTSPFLFGVLSPKIYLPTNLSAADRENVIAHEMAHMKRGDHWWKPLGFILLSVNWFNPLFYLGYVLFCRDIEMACDERVVRNMDHTERAGYSQTILTYSIRRAGVSSCPPAFGAGDAKARIQAALYYRKSSFWVIFGSLLLCVVTAICFLTGPIRIRNPYVREYVTGSGDILGHVDMEKYESISENFAIGADQYGRAVFKNPFAAFRTMKKLYGDGLQLIRDTYHLPPISHWNYHLYQLYGWQVTSGSELERQQASFVSGFLDLYENSFLQATPDITITEENHGSKTGISETVQGE